MGVCFSVKIRELPAAQEGDQAEAELSPQRSAVAASASLGRFGPDAKDRDMSAWRLKVPGRLVAPCCSPSTSCQIRVAQLLGRRGGETWRLLGRELASVLSHQGSGQAWLIRKPSSSNSSRQLSKEFIKTRRKKKKSHEYKRERPGTKHLLSKTTNHCFSSI